MDKSLKKTTRPTFKGPPLRSSSPPSLLSLHGSGCIPKKTTASTLSLSQSAHPCFQPVSSSLPVFYLRWLLSRTSRRTTCDRPLSRRNSYFDPWTHGISPITIGIFFTRRGRHSTNRKKCNPPCARIWTPYFTTARYTLLLLPQHSSIFFS